LLRAMNRLDGGPHTTAYRDGGEASASWISQMVKFMRVYRRCEDDQLDLTRLAREHPPLFWAHFIYNADVPQGPSKWAIEAHILARETDRQIAFRVGCSEETIAAYEALFFNVRDKLTHKEYILNSVLSQSITAGLYERDHDLLWKLFG
jgi:hypothetical protein